MEWEIKMSDNQKILELEKKVSELERLNEKDILTNEIKDLLNKNIEFNEDLKKIVNENKEKLNINEKNCWEYFIRPISIILYLLLTWFIISDTTNKIIEYNKTYTKPIIGQVTPNAK